jgi:hypothetical protein
MLKFPADAPLTRLLVVQRSVRLVIVTALLALFTRFASQSHWAQPGIITVCATGCDHETIQAAINDSSTDAGDTIQVLDAMHTEAGIIVTKSVTIAGVNASGTVVQAHAVAGAASDRVFAVAAGTSAIIQDMIVRHGKVSDHPARGGGILNQGTLALERVAVIDNLAIGSDGYPGGLAEGGGIYNNGSLVVVSSVVSSNDATAGDGSASGADGGDGHGGGIANGTGGTLAVINSTVSGNAAVGGYGYG